jgi:hypothetical protein
MAIKDYLPFTNAPNAAIAKAKQAQLVEPKAQKKLAKLMKATTLALGVSPIFGTRSAFEAAPYDFDRIIRAIDTDSYAKQAFNKYRELMWMNGWDLVSGDPDVVEYLYQRIDFMEIAMKQPFQQFLETVADQLVKFHNCFIVRARGDLRPYFPGKIKPVGRNEFPVVGYEIVPAETMRIERDARNRPKKYRQEFDGHMTYDLARAPEWEPHEVIHLFVDRKPGHLFGTPFMTAVMDDLQSLRQMEEDTLNLTHQELFPFYSVTVGTPEEPAEEEEIIQAAQEIGDMLAEGAIVHSERRKIEAIGGEGKALKVENYLDRFLNRVCAGLGLSPHHLGIMIGESGNRAVTDRLDVALYIKIKSYQKYIAAAFRVFMINELLLEGGYNPYNRDEHLTEFRFNEIDVDTQVKLEAHYIQMWAQNVITLEEVRIKLHLDPDVTEADLLMAMSARLAPDQVVTPKPGPNATTQPKPQLVDTTPAGAKKDTQKPSTGGRPNQRNTARRGGNAVRPQNQHGRRTSPNIRHDDNLDEIVELLDEGNEEL